MIQKLENLEYWDTQCDKETTEKLNPPAFITNDIFDCKQLIRYLRIILS